MRKVWLCIFYALCIFTIVFSLFWMALPSLPFPADSGEETPASEPGLAAQGSAGQSGTDFYLCDEGGRVVVYTCSDNGLPDKRLLRTGIYVNLLPEADALRLKQGLYVTGETALRALLEDLGEYTKTVQTLPGEVCTVFILYQNQASSCSSGTRLSLRHCS